MKHCISSRVRSTMDTSVLSFNSLQYGFMTSLRLQNGQCHAIRGMSLSFKVGDQWPGSNLGGPRLHFRNAIIAV